MTRSRDRERLLGSTGGPYVKADFTCAATTTRARTGDARLERVRQGPRAPSKSPTGSTRGSAPASSTALRARLFYDRPPASGTTSSPARWKRGSAAASCAGITARCCATRSGATLILGRPVPEHRPAPSVRGGTATAPPRQKRSGPHEFSSAGAFVCEPTPGRQREVHPQPRPRFRVRWSIISSLDLRPSTGLLQLPMVFDRYSTSAGPLCRAEREHLVGHGPLSAHSPAALGGGVKVSNPSPADRQPHSTATTDVPAEPRVRHRPLLLRCALPHRPRSRWLTLAAAAAAPTSTLRVQLKRCSRAPSHAW